MLTDSPKALVIDARDGFPLAANVFPGGSRRFVIVAPATGVRRSYYRQFATFLAKRGWSALTFDYRGIGDSRPDSLRGFEATMLDWAELDLAGVVDYAEQQLGAEEIAVVGHSFGGQAVGLLPNADRIRTFIGVGAQLGDLRLFPAFDRAAFTAVMAGLVPLATSTLGYLPGRLGGGEDLPRGVALQWARWCLQPGYYVGGKRAPRHERFQHVTARIRLYSFDDDRYAPAATVDALAALYAHTPVDRVHLRAVDYGGSIGHFGFFRRRFESSLWPEALRFLEGSKEAVVAPGNEESLLNSFLYDRYARTLS
jgi:predicted alpha/beta hydrolase